MEGAPEAAHPDISIVHVEGDLFFGAAEILQEQVRRICEDPNLQVVVLRMKNATTSRHLRGWPSKNCCVSRADRGSPHPSCAGASARSTGFFALRILEQFGRENFFMEVPSTHPLHAQRPAGVPRSCRPPRRQHPHLRPTRRKRPLGRARVRAGMIICHGAWVPKSRPAFPTVSENSCRRSTGFLCAMCCALRSASACAAICARRSTSRCSRFRKAWPTR